MNDGEIRVILLVETFLFNQIETREKQFHFSRFFFDSSLVVSSLRSCRFSFNFLSHSFKRKPQINLPMSVGSNGGVKLRMRNKAK